MSTKLLYIFHIKGITVPIILFVETHSIYSNIIFICSMLCILGLFIDIVEYIFKT